MKLNKKDQSFILLIIATLVIFYSIYSLFSYLFFTATFHRSDVSKVITEDSSKQTQEWFNTTRPLKNADLKNRVILLNFWSYDCVDCESTILKIKRLELQHGSKLTVIGVHSGNTSNKNESQEIIKSILKNNITYPVVNDINLKIGNDFEIKKLPSLVLINAHGAIEKTYVTEKEIADIDTDVEDLVAEFKYKISHKALPIFLEENAVTANVLSFPSKLEYAKLFNYKSRQVPAIFIANSGENNIVIINLLGEIILKIGAESGGFKDGSFDEAAFNYPKGLLYNDGKLYIADTGNNALREINFETEKVTTLIGSGERGDVIKKTTNAEDFNLAYPSDIEFSSDNKNIIIANSGSHQLLAYNLKDKKVSILAGNGSDGNEDGEYPDNSLSQISDIAVYGENIYLVDSKFSSLRVLKESGKIETLANGKETGSLSRPTGLMVDDTGAYITDAASQSVKRYEFSSGKINNFIGARERGDNIGSASSTQFNEPNGIIAILNQFYISDSNNNRIISVNRGGLEVDLFEVMPPLKLSKEGFLQYLPNLQKSDNLVVAADKEISVKISLEGGWKINEKGPSFINLLEFKKDKQADLVASFDWSSIRDENVKLTKLTSGKNYTLQGVIYYCEDKKNSLCYVKSYEQKVAADDGEKQDTVTIKLGN
jgi:thiol-disulfide isomerase/thioredoxin